MTTTIRNLIDQIRDIQAEQANPVDDETGEAYYDTDWTTNLADLAVQLADAVEPKLKDNGGPLAAQRREHEARMAAIDREVRRSWRNPRYR